MAYHSTHDRSPFIDAQLQAVLERRCRAFGIALIGLSVLIGMMVWSYSPEDLAGSPQRMRRSICWCNGGVDRRASYACPGIFS